MINGLLLAICGAILAGAFVFGRISASFGIFILVVAIIIHWSKGKN